MRLDRMQRHGTGGIVDAVVIGTGAGGAPLLAELAAKGLNVVALEAGRHWRPTDHTPDESEATELNWMEERLSAGEQPVAFGPNNSGTGVGGSTLHWGAFVPRPLPTCICASGRGTARIGRSSIENWSPTSNASNASSASPGRPTIHGTPRADTRCLRRSATPRPTRWRAAACR